MRKLTLLIDALLFCMPCLAQVLMQQGKTVVIAPTCSTAKDSVTGTTADQVAIGNFSSHTYIATKFVAGSSYTVCKATIPFFNTLSPTGSITMYIYSDSPGAPGTQIGTGSGAVLESSFPGTEGTAIAFTGMSAAVVSGTTYWLVAALTGDGNGSAYANWPEATSSSGTIDNSSDGISWNGLSSFSNAPKFTLFSN